MLIARSSDILFANLLDLSLPFAVISTDGNVCIEKAYRNGDDEFADQTIANVNHVCKEKLQICPPVSQLEPEKYAPQGSALLEEHIAGYLNGMTVQQVTYLISI